MDMSVVKRRDAARKRHGEREWAALLEAFERSGEQARVFCQRHGISVSSLCYWRKRLKKTKGNAEGRFVDLGSALGLRLGSDQESAAKIRAEVNLGDGIVLRVYR